MNQDGKCCHEDVMRMPVRWMQATINGQKKKVLVAIMQTSDVKVAWECVFDSTQLFEHPADSSIHRTL